MRKEKSQHEQVLYQNHSEFGIFVHNITSPQLKIWLSICYMFTSSKIIVQLNSICFCWVDTIRLTENEYMIIQKNVRYLMNKFTHIAYLVASPFLWRELHFSILTNWNHPPYLWYNLILIYLIKVIVILALMQHIFILLFDSFLQKGFISSLMTTMWDLTDVCANQLLIPV